MTSERHSPTPPVAPSALIRWIWQLTEDVWNEYRKDGAGDLAASITFWTILSIPAAALALVSALTQWFTAPAVFAGVVLWCATLFHIGRNHRTPWRHDLPGALVTAIGWVTASQLFALYVRFTGNANEVQTGVGAILLALSLVYVLSLVLVVGAEVNDVLARRSGVVQQPRSIKLPKRLRRSS